MGVGKAVLLVTSPQAKCEVRMDHVAGPLHVLLPERRGEGLIYYNVSQTLSI